MFTFFNIFHITAYTMHILWIVTTPTTKLIASKTKFYILLYYSWFIKYDNVSSISEKRQDFSFLNAFCLVSIHRIVSEISSFEVENNFEYFNVAMPFGWSNIFSSHASAALSQAWWLCGGQWRTLSGRLFAITTRRTHFQKKTRSWQIVHIYARFKWYVLYVIL